MKAAGSKAKKSRQAAKLRVVLDTDVLLKALLQYSEEAQALRLTWQHGQARPLVCPASAQLLMAALAYPGFDLSLTAQHELLADFLPYAEACKPRPAGPGPRVPRSQSLALILAEQGRADVLVSDAPSLHRLQARRAAAWPPRLRLLSLHEWLRECAGA